jgi:predicted small secreted protein
MKKLLLIMLLVFTCFTATACAPNGNTIDPPGRDVINGQTWNVIAPDGGIQVSLVLDDFGSMYYKVYDGDVSVVDYCSLGFELEEEDLTQLLNYVSEETNIIDVNYENISGKSRYVNAKCNEQIITLKGISFYLDITMRAYDDGYAFRYGIRAVDGSNGVITVNTEESQFALPEDSITWIQPYKTNTLEKDCFSYEESYTRKRADGLADRDISMPMLYRAGKSDIYSLITESGLIGSGYYGSFLSVPENSENPNLLQTIHSPAGIDVENDNQIFYPFESPWRLGITGTIDEVIESELVEKVYDDIEYWKPDNYEELSVEEQQTYTYDWVEPGVVAWNWLIETSVGNKSQNDYQMQIDYVDHAAEMGWKYTILDGGWNSGTFDLKKFCDYAHSKGVKVIVWCNALSDFANGNEAILRTKLSFWKSQGVDGIKIDFFDGQNATNPTHQGEDIDTITWYETIYQVTAELQMVVNCHGSNKPTGERRLYPHVLNREAIRGNEFTNVGSTITVNSMFVRGVIGLCDFTPVVTPLSTGLTMGHQIALSILYESGLPSMADYDFVYTNDLIKDLYKSIPSIRDKTVFICGELEGYYVAAIKSGDDWFVAGINQVIEHFVDVNYSFLDDGEYSATYYTDSDKTIEKTTGTIKSTDIETFNLVKNGGFVVHLKKK